MPQKYIGAPKLNQGSTSYQWTAPLSKGEYSKIKREHQCFCKVNQQEPFKF